MRIIALTYFADALTGRDYRAGEEVPWPADRAEHYAARGLVTIVEEPVEESVEEPMPSKAPSRKKRGRHGSTT